MRQAALWKRAFGAAAAVSLAAILGACSFSPTVTAHSISYNKAYGDSFNEQLLLNTVRASREHPLSFTRLTSVTQNINATADTSSALGLEHGMMGLALGPKNLGIASRFAGTTSPTFQVAPLASKEFYQGILAPLHPDLFKTFWDAGVPPGLLIHLLVDRIEVYGKNYKCYFRNDPLDRRRYELFTELVDRFVRQHNNLERSGGRGRGASAVDEMGALVSAADGQGRGTKVREQRTHGAIGTDSAFRLSGNGSLLFVHSDLDRAPPASPCRRVTDYSFDDQGHGPPSVKLRSVEGLFRYLGRVVAAQHSAADPFMPTALTATGERRAIFVVRQGRGGAELVTSYRGQRYAVPEGAEGGFSMRTLSVLSQVFHLSLRSDVLPKSNTVIIAN